MPEARQYAVFGPLLSGVETRAFLGCEVIQDKPRQDLPVVVVWLPEDVTSDPKSVARLQRETSFVTQLRHPNIIRVYGLECFEEGWARVVAFADGEPISRLLTRAREEFRPIDPRFAARIIVDVCEGVHHAHEEGQSRYAGRPIVHGGVRPDTLIITFKGRTMVTGYGAAILAPTQHGVPLLDKFVYFAPEQIIGGKATASPATDVYAIGTVLYEMIAGHPPFTGAADVERAVLTGDPPMVEATGLAGRLGNIAATAMAKRGADRFDSVEVMRDAVMKAVADDNVELPDHDELAEFVSELIPPSSPERTGRRELLLSASEPDSVTVLSRPDDVPEGIDADLFEASRPGPVSTTHAPIDPAPAVALRQPLPREPITVIEEPHGGEPVSDPVASSPLDPESFMQPAALPTFDPASATNWDTAVSEPPVAPSSAPVVSGSSSEEQAVLEAATMATSADRAPTEAGTSPNPIPSATTDVVRPRDPTARSVEDAEAFETASPVVQPVLQSAAQAVVAPQGGVQPGAPQFGAQGTMQPAPQPNAQGAMQPGGQQFGVQGAMQPAPQPNAQGAMQPGGQQFGVQGGLQPGAQQFGAPGAMQPGAQQFGAPPPGAFVPQQGGAQMHPSQVPQVAPTFVPQAPQHGGGTFAPPPPANTGPQPGIPGSFVGRSAPGANGTGNLPHPPPAAVPRAPIRDDSSITAFSKREGDGSRSLIFIVIAALVGVLIFIFAFPKEPPKGLDEAAERHRLPKELVRAAIENAGREDPTADDVDNPDDIEDPESAPTGDDPSLTMNPDGTPAEVVPIAPRTGTLSIESEPRVTVYIENESLGRTPLTTTLPTGRHRLRFTDRKTGINVYRRYRIRPGGEHKDRITFGTSALLVNAPDGAKIDLNGKRIGVAPMEAVTIYEGQYLLKVRLDESSWSERFDAPPGRKIEYNVRLGN